MACGRLSGLQRKGSAGRLYCRCGSMARNPESKSLVRVLLFAACLLNSSYSFVQQMLPSPVVSGTAAGSCTVQARSLSARAGYVRHLRSSRASCTMSSKAGDKGERCKNVPPSARRTSISHIFRTNACVRSNPYFVQYSWTFYFYKQQ